MTDSTKAGLRDKERPASKILRGLSEAAAWAHGEGAARVHIPGQPPRMMTRAEFDAAIISREDDRARASGIPVQGGEDAEAAL